MNFQRQEKQAISGSSPISNFINIRKLIRVQYLILWTFFKFLHISRPGVSNLGVRIRIPLGPQEKNEPLTIPVERFVSMVRFDSKGKLDDLGLEFSPLALKSNR